MMTGSEGQVNIISLDMVTTYPASTIMLLLLLLSDGSNNCGTGFTIQYGYDASDIQIHSIMIHPSQSGGAGA